MRNGFPTGKFTVTTSSAELFPVDGVVTIVEESGDYELTTPDSIVISMKLEASGCLHGVHAGRSLVVCQTGVDPVTISGIVTVLSEMSNGGGQWTAEGGG